MNTPRYDIIGQALSDTSSARMLCELMEGRAFTNKELAAAAGISAPTATAHLRLLQDAGFVVAEKSGRCVYHRIANSEVAQTLEQLATLQPSQRLYSTQQKKAGDLAVVRSCYDHLAGPLAVAMTDALLRMGAMVELNGAFEPQPAGIWNKLGVTLPERPGRKPFARPCLDWTERKPHIAGPLGRQILTQALDLQWMKRRRHKRGLHLTRDGVRAFEQMLKLDAELMEKAMSHG